MGKYCPACGSGSEKYEEKEWDEDPIHLVSVQILCTSCGYGWNCVGTKKIK